MTQGRKVSCDHLIDYLFGELSYREQLAFEDHVKNCQACHEELRITLKAHERLSEDDIDVPGAAWFEEHKERLLQPAFASRSSVSSNATNDRISQWAKFARHFRRKAVWSSTLAISIAIVGASFVWFGSSGRNMNNNTPIRFVQKISLLPNKPYPDAHGLALVTNNHNRANLIIYVNNVPEQDTWGCYDVWGVKGGTRYSLGEFTVDQNGNGALSVSLTAVQKYDSLEVTREPQWGDKKPLGPQVLQGTWTPV